MKAVVAAFNQEKALVGAFSVIANFLMQFGCNFLKHYYRRPALARTLTQLAEAGDRGEADLGFYTGSIGRDLVADLEAAGGIITQADLASYRHTCRRCLTRPLPLIC